MLVLPEWIAFLKTIFAQNIASRQRFGEYQSSEAWPGCEKAKIPAPKIRRREGVWGLALLMRPAERFPARRSWSCRYAIARTQALALRGRLARWRHAHLRSAGAATPSGAWP
jgi:hypothetical protein